jgi:hypothetical protein
MWTAIQVTIPMRETLLRIAAAAALSVAGGALFGVVLGAVVRLLL